MTLSREVSLSGGKEGCVDGLESHQVVEAACVNQKYEQPEEVGTNWSETSFQPIISHKPN